MWLQVSRKERDKGERQRERDGGVKGKKFQISSNVS